MTPNIFKALLSIIGEHANAIGRTAFVLSSFEGQLLLLLLLWNVFVDIWQSNRGIGKDNALAYCVVGKSWKAPLQILSGWWWVRFD